MGETEVKEKAENMHRLIGGIPGINYSVSREKRILSSYLASGVQPRDIFQRGLKIYKVIPPFCHIDSNPITECFHCTDWKSVMLPRSFY